MSVKLIWATPDADKVIGYCARVSSPANQDNPDVSKLLRYCAEHKHWSIFEMATMCVEVNTTRDVGRQILRHSFNVQEFSQRYQSAGIFDEAPNRECRMQDSQNRQNSLPTDDEEIAAWWDDAQDKLRVWSTTLYFGALNKGIAKEQARALLPEGLTMSRMYLSAPLRTWIHYIQVRTDASTQKEHRTIAEQCRQIFQHVAPETAKAVFN